MKSSLFSLYLLLLLPFYHIGQKNRVFYTNNPDGFPISVSKILQDQSTNQVSKSIQAVQFKCIEKGFYLVDIRLSSSSSLCDSFLVDLGNQYDGINLEFDDSTASQLSPLISSKRMLQKETQNLSPARYASFMNQVLTYFVDHGFPFCRVYLNQVLVGQKVLTANLILDKGPYVVWKEIHLKNDLSISMNSIQSIIGIQLNDAFNESIFNSIEDRVLQTGIFSLKKKCEVLFTEKGAELFVYLEQLKASSAQGIVGFQPNPTTNQVTFTGDLQLKLINAAKYNESFLFAWKSIQPQTQSLQSTLTIPYLFKSSFGVSGEFQLFKRDSSYLDVKTGIGIQYQFQNGWQLRANYHFLSSSVLSEMNVNPMFSKLESLQLNAYGLFLFKRKLDYIPNPRDGFSVLIEGQIGERKSLNKEESVWKTHAVFDYFQPIAQRMTLYGQLQFDAYHAPNIYENELFRFGGSNSFRGFDEESIFATTKAIATLEFRFLLDRNSSVFAFFNQAYYENSATTYKNDHPYGFGVGISTGTSLGVFRLSYALGSQLNNPISFNAGKIHLGYISYF